MIQLYNDYYGKDDCQSCGHPLEDHRRGTECFYHAHEGYRPCACGHFISASRRCGICGHSIDDHHIPIYGLTSCLPECDCQSFCAVLQIQNNVGAREGQDRE